MNLARIALESRVAPRDPWQGLADTVVSTPPTVITEAPRKRPSSHVVSTRDAYALVLAGVLLGLVIALGIAVWAPRHVPTVPRELAIVQQLQPGETCTLYVSHESRN